MTVTVTHSSFVTRSSDKDKDRCQRTLKSAVQVNLALRPHLRGSSFQMFLTVSERLFPWLTMFQLCPKKKCCGKDNKCGEGLAYCSEGCQLNWGFCWKNATSCKMPRFGKVSHINGCTFVGPLVLALTKANSLTPMPKPLRTSRRLFALTVQLPSSAPALPTRSQVASG